MIYDIPALIGFSAGLPFKLSLQNNLNRDMGGKFPVYAVAMLLADDLHFKIDAMVFTAAALF